MCVVMNGTMRMGVVLVALFGLVACGSLELEIPDSSSAESGTSHDGRRSSDGRGSVSSATSTSGRSIGPGSSDPSGVSGVSGVSIPGGPNGCGGDGALLHEGTPAELMAPCGCGGVLVCNGTEALRCAGEAPRNACGGCGVLEAEPETPCGPCGGTWRCAEGQGGLVCTGAGLPNGCGGCERLSGAPGERCDGPDDEEARAWFCRADDSVACTLVGEGGNACGGEQELRFAGRPAQPGQTCSDAERVCGEGVLVCESGLDTLRCEGTPRNAVGGCGLLPGLPGEACACGGQWVPDGLGGVRCSGGQRNACGGCGALSSEPGSACGEAGRVVCVGADNTICLADLEGRNACGGVEELGHSPGEPCGECGSGRWRCVGAESVSCVGDLGDLALHPCDGTCREFPVPGIGNACGTCEAGVRICRASDLACEGGEEEVARNECGGCGPLAGKPGEDCGRCAQWACAEDTASVQCRVNREIAGCANEPLRCSEIADSCADDNRVCAEGGGGEDAACGDCLPEFEEVNGACPYRRLGARCTDSEECGPGAWCTNAPAGRRCAPEPVVRSVALPFHFVPAGEFRMGSPRDEAGRNPDLEDVVDVRITRNFFVQETPLTQGQWRAVMEAWNARGEEQREMTGWTGPTPVFGTSPSRAEEAGTCTRPDCPVERVSWWDAVVFANVLSVLEGLEPCYELRTCDDVESGRGAVGGGCRPGESFCTTSETFSCDAIFFSGLACEGYRLPTEAEWEYAARAGTETATYAGDLEGLTGCVTLSGTGRFPAGTELKTIAHYGCGGTGRPMPVGELAANDWGLQDTLGNVAEWTWSPFSEEYFPGDDPLGGTEASNARRTRRGSSHLNQPSEVRAARRTSERPGHRSGLEGFRLVRTAQ